MSADSWRTASSGQDVGLISRAECRGPIQVGWWYGEITRYGQRGGGMRKCMGGAGPINSANFQDVARYSILVLTRNSYLPFLHMIACMYEINASIFWRSLGKHAFQVGAFEFKCARPWAQCNDRACSTFAPVACFS